MNVVPVSKSDDNQACSSSVAHGVKNSPMKNKMMINNNNNAMMNKMKSSQGSVQQDKDFGSVGTLDPFGGSGVQSQNRFQPRVFEATDNDDDDPPDISPSLTCPITKTNNQHS
jgi:hypothetical protein